MLYGFFVTQHFLEFIIQNRRNDYLANLHQKQHTNKNPPLP